VKTVQTIGLPLPMEPGLVFRVIHLAMLPVTLTSYLGALPDEALGTSFVIRRG
jgi:hypothetical protein